MQDNYLEASTYFYTKILQILPNAPSRSKVLHLKNYGLIIMYTILIEEAKVQAPVTPQEKHRHLLLQPDEEDADVGASMVGS